MTKESKLIVFKHTDFLKAGIQVPGRSIEEGEDPLDAVLREVYEESGLKNVDIVAFLGVHEYDMSPYRKEVQIRYVYHLELNHPAKNEWRYYETHPDSGRESISFDFYWVRLDNSDLHSDGGQGKMLHKLVESKV